MHWGVRGKPGFSYPGHFIKLEGENIHLKDEKGKAYSLPFTKLTETAVAYAKKLDGKEAEEAAKAAAPKEEDWTNEKGVVIKASFVALNREKVTLKLANGKESTFALNLLSKESRTRAQGYAK